MSFCVFMFAVSFFVCSSLTGLFGAELQPLNDNEDECITGILDGFLDMQHIQTLASREGGFWGNLAVCLKDIAVEKLQHRLDVRSSNSEKRGHYFSVTTFGDDRRIYLPTNNGGILQNYRDKIEKVRQYFLYLTNILRFDRNLLEDWMLLREAWKRVLRAICMVPSKYEDLLDYFLVKNFCKNRFSRNEFEDVLDSSINSEIFIAKFNGILFHGDMTKIQLASEWQQDWNWCNKELFGFELESDVKH